MATPYLDAVRERVVIFDGAFGTGVQEKHLTADDFGGPELEGCNEMLVLTRPDVIGELHENYLRVGCDVLETCTFGAFGVALGEYGIADKTYEINVAAARIAKEVASSYSTADKPRFVSGSMGPPTRSTASPRRSTRCSTAWPSPSRRSGASWPTRVTSCAPRSR